ncbi:S8 family peptidase [Acidicapsa acidisoli]|uniref:S8 family peptidase n=1 Tax=Acidicapsa acidisoli TaxID=1615681 RepID=UPI0021DFCB65|nr:S8 family serine peptidase [Acidicapsa acidisoli]
MPHWMKPLACALFLFASMLFYRASAQEAAAKKKVTSDADLPRISYPLTGSASDLLAADDATFDAFTRKVTADIDSILASYQIDDKPTLRGYLLAKFNAQILAGDPKGALATINKVRDLEEKPEARITDGILSRPLLNAWIETGSSSGPAFASTFLANFQKEVNALPWAAVQDTVKELKASFQIMSPSLFAGSYKANVDPQVAKTGSIDYSAAVNLLSSRVVVKFQLPLKEQIEAVLVPYIQAHTEKKPDIWATREVTLTETEKLTPVRIGIWDSGVDTALYPKQLFTDPSPGVFGPHGLAFDLDGKPYVADLQPLTAEQTSLYPKALELEQGMDDAQNSIDSPAADAARKYLSTTPPDQLAPFLKQLNFLGQYMHGTHVAGIAVRGNPAARLVVLEFNDGLPDLPFAPTEEWANRFKADFLQLGNYVREHNVRVVNMSWADSQSEIEQWLNKTSTEKDPELRKQFAAKIYRIWKEAVEGAIRSAPNTLFVCAAGNSDSNPGFLGDVPASLKEPNLLTVGAVDQAGEETSFTSYGPTVVLDADGFQVESFVPGGTRMKFSGTSMASPNVANLAAKLIAIDPSLTPEKVIALMEKAADPSPDGRRHLINPKATVALLKNQAQ